MFKIIHEPEDVYKRQYKYSTINEVNHCEFGEAVVGDIQLTERMFHLVPVSYTHLDVYKRQVYMVALRDEGKLI